MELFWELITVKLLIGVSKTISLDLAVISSQNSSNRDPINYNDDYIHSCSRIYRNDTSSSITVTEVGMYTSIQNLGTILLAREILEAPVVIEPGKTYNFSMVVS